MIDQFLDGTSSVVCHGDARNCAWNPCFIGKNRAKASPMVCQPALPGNNTGIVQLEQKFRMEHEQSLKVLI